MEKFLEYCKSKGYVAEIKEAGTNGYFKATIKLDDEFSLTGQLDTDTIEKNHIYGLYLETSEDSDYVRKHYPLNVYNEGKWEEYVEKWESIKSEVTANLRVIDAIDECIHHMEEKVYDICREKLGQDKLQGAKNEDI